ncbi:MAG: helix-turn-helix domain-containing protein [Halanaerobium sp. 4-GBenrich]|jgi:transcriptional regulator with XRE-family HTH domain|uniref:Helix-turn-helix protein n=1 Tax=Halanaerobium congolense TaxID=54121 RepID=A0A1M7MKX2_9FIRM|nr:helix-turn-helix transcriptional regulator [Halanaerobium congolense]KXS50552.1 MAG: helix-turn-helix domain-containing protein [Halanaerobium sp. T82-1]ODS49673.1 MAG: helix-turn-helix domain-containing protein [Halanaerobium sp. 4-GBenrich]TDS31145.1 helix-turn-helix protein [Halanaerobium congolense]SDK48504.1 Helix-turn-helix [Halanaerobium congolense]SDM10714.1 Helix-turn-helix [Halanaerobium congolense]
MQTEDLGKKIKKYRIVQDLTQESLGEKAGLHYTYIGQVERGEKEPSLKALNKIAEALEIGVDKLLINYNLSSGVTIQISNITDLLLDRSQQELEMIYTLLKNLIEIIDTQANIEKKE